MDSWVLFINNTYAINRRRRKCITDRDTLWPRWPATSNGVPIVINNRNTYRGLASILNSDWQWKTKYNASNFFNNKCSWSFLLKLRDSLKNLCFISQFRRQCTKKYFSWRHILKHDWYVYVLNIKKYVRRINRLQLG